MHPRLAFGAIVFLGVFAASARARSGPADPALGSQGAGLEVLATIDHGTTAAAIGADRLNATAIPDPNLTLAPAAKTAGVSGNWLISRAPETKPAPAAGRRGPATTELFRFPAFAEVGGGIPDIQGLDQQAARFALPGTNEPSLTPVPEAQTYGLLIGLIALVYALFCHRRTFDRRHQLALRPDRWSTGL
jgi:hypothetical protein